MSCRGSQIILVIAYVLCVHIAGNYLFKLADNVCMTKVCIIEAANLLQSLDPYISPCDDFYGFVCGKWVQNTPTPDKWRTDQVSEHQKDINHKIKGLINDVNYETENRQFVRNVKSFYESCYNTTQLEMLGHEPLRDLLDRLGGWPLIARDNWNEVKWDDLYLRLRDEGIDDNTLFRISIGPNYYNNSRNILFLSRPTYGMGDSDSVLKGPDDPVVRAYKNMMSKVIAKLSDNTDNESAVEDIFSIEHLLADATRSIQLRTNRTGMVEKMNITELMRLSPNINWLKLLKGVVSQDVSENDEIILYDTFYIRFLNEILPNYRDDQWANLLIWRAVQSTMTLLSDEWKSMSEEFELIRTGKNDRLPRGDHCFKLVKKLDMAISHLYIGHYFGEQDKKEVKRMACTLVRSMRQIICDNDWMGNKTREEALKKLNNMKFVVGYPKQLTDERLVGEHYKDLTMTADDYFGNSLRLDKWTSRLQFDKLREQVPKYDWKTVSNVVEVNAYYSPRINFAKLLAGHSGGVFFHKDRPDYLNYGAYGSTIGHEITHGFDNNGRKYDFEGRRRSWWDQTTNEQFISRTQCYIDQYSNFTVEEVGHNLNGARSLAENIADNEGIAIAYKAYLQYGNRPEPQLPGLPYTPEQLFWISSAYQECVKYSEQTLRNFVLKDEGHTPQPFRVNGYVMNSPEFSSVFNCPVDSPMNPRNKCKLW